jgi:hypothetical protein
MIEEHSSTTGLVGNVPDLTATHLDTTKLTDWSHIDQSVATLNRTETKSQSNHLSRTGSKFVSADYTLCRSVKVPPDIGS